MINLRHRSVFLIPLLFAATNTAADIRIAPLAGEQADCVPLVRDALQRARVGGDRVVFAPGTYHFFPERAFEQYAQISNHESGLRRIAFPLIGCKGVEIDGAGATFVMHGLITPFLIDHAENVTVKNLSIDWAQPFHLQGTVVAVDADQQAFELQVLPESHAWV